MKIAIIGAGISGLGAALALKDTADVHLFEQDPRFGGHANTVVVDYDGEETPVDTGFIVFNDRNYPNLCALFDHLGVASETSDMSFSVSLDRGRLEYACDDLDRVFAQRWRVLDPKFLWSFREIMRFNRVAKAALESGALEGLSLGAFLDQHGFAEGFRQNFLYGMGGAIWSTPSAEISAFPAKGFVTFFANHALLHGFGRVITWRTVSGGSREYVRRALQELGPRAQAGVGARALRRRVDGRVEIAFSDGAEGVFDQVLLAGHPDQSLAVMEDADAEERSILSAVRYRENTAVLHRDPALMPKRRKVWSSWNFLNETGANARPAAVSYWMNRLQNIDRKKPLFVTLNPPREPDPNLVFGRYSYAHPQYDQAAFDAQTRLDDIQGRGGLWYAGAWTRWGFHEDGLRSGLRVAAALGATPVWARDLGAPIRGLAIAAE
ncbi:MAG: FAD-dependent oxidoreductase [Pseudomonadota bacterium]